MHGEIDDWSLSDEQWQVQCHGSLLNKWYFVNIEYCIYIPKLYTYLCSIIVCLILDSSVGLGIPYADDLVSQTSKVGILHSAEEDNLSPFDSKSLPCAGALSKSNKHINGQS